MKIDLEFLPTVIFLKGFQTVGTWLLRPYGRNSIPQIAFRTHLTDRSLKCDEHSGKRDLVISGPASPDRGRAIPNDAVNVQHAVCKNPPGVSSNSNFSTSRSNSLPRRNTRAQAQNGAAANAPGHGKTVARRATTDPTTRGIL